MYDSPKAAHFKAIDINGAEVRTAAALADRWLVAKAVAKAGVQNMLRLSESDKSKIVDACIYHSGDDVQFVPATFDVQW